MDTTWLFNIGAAAYGWFTGQSAWRRSCERLADHLPDVSPLTIADLGCGPGVSAIGLGQRRPDARIVCLDRAPRMLLEAKERLWEGGVAGRSHLVHGDALCLPFAAESLNAITGHSFLYLLPDRETALREAFRVLKPGGRIILMEPNAQRVSLGQILGVSTDPRFLVSVGLWRPFSFWHGRFTADSLCAAFSAAGFIRCAAEPTLGGLGLLGWAEKPQPASEPRRRRRRTPEEAPAHPRSPSTTRRRRRAESAV